MSASPVASLSSKKAVRSDIWAMGAYTPKFQTVAVIRFSPGLRQRGEVEALVAPVGQVAAGWAIADSLPVHVQNKAVVGADANDVSWRGPTPRSTVRRKCRTKGSRKGAVGWVIHEAFHSR